MDAAYHQLIANAFRAAHPYGQAQSSPAQLQKILDDVYSKFSLL
jgi:hypothetical protein